MPDDDLTNTLLTEYESTAELLQKGVNVSAETMNKYHGMTGRLLAATMRNLNDCGALFSDPVFKFGIWHHRIPWGRVTGSLFRAFEDFFNKGWARQTFWEMSGLAIPGECRWQAVKPWESIK